VTRDSSDETSRRLLAPRRGRVGASAPADSSSTTLKLSIVVVAYDIPRELPRTLRSLSVGYQQAVDVEDYEVIVVDNGSPTPVDPAVFKGLQGQFRLVQIDDAPPSPAHAVNVGLRAARGETIGVMLDGARLASPGLVRFVLAGSRVYPESAIAILGWYLGYDFQRYALDVGWSRADEDHLLETIGWPGDGYRLFEIATLDESSVGGWFEAIFESNALFLPARAWDELGGCDECFTSPGGGIVNHDLLYRAGELKSLGWVILLGEATFHQLHGGIATNSTPEQNEESMKEWLREYRSVRGHEPGPPRVSDPVYLGTLPKSVRTHVAHALNTRLYGEGVVEAPLATPIPLPDPAAEPDPAAAQWMHLAVRAARRGLDIEAMLFARAARAAAPTSLGWPALLACVAGNCSADDLPGPRRAQFHVECGQANELLGSADRAAEHYHEAFAADPGNTFAYLGLSRLRMPGPFYDEVLAQLHEELVPATYLEIGVSEGRSLAAARPPTVAVGVDPAPAICEPIAIEYHLYPETSNEFFERRDVRKLFGGAGPSVAFIDGLHTFPAVLEDFWRVEAISDPDTLIVLHDMIPLDEITQRAERVYHFYTGDVWKLLHCLADVRPDLSWFTVRTPPSGLTVVSGLDPSSTVLRDRYTELVERFGGLTFDQASDIPGLVVDNDWRLVADQLRQWRAGRTPPAPATPAADDAAAQSPSRTELAQRVRQREEELRRATGTRRAQPWELERVEARLQEWKVALDAANAHLDAIQQSRLLRWTRPLRRVYQRLHGRRAPSASPTPAQRAAAVRPHA